MKKRIAFLCTRNNALKKALPIIEVMLDTGEAVPILITSTRINIGSKSDQNYDARFNLFHDKMEVLFIDDWEDLVGRVISHKIDIVTANCFIDLSHLRVLSKQGTKFIYLQDSFNPITYPAIYPAESYELIAGHFYYSDYYKQLVSDQLRRYLGFTDNQVAELNKKSFIVGDPELDSVASFKRDEILKKYSIPNTGEKIIFFDPMFIKSGYPNYFYQYYFRLYGSKLKQLKQFGKHYLRDCYRLNIRSVYKTFIGLLRVYNTKTRISKYEELFLNLRRYCNEHNYLLISKSRRKNNDPPFISELCDYYTYDRSYLPFTLSELIYISDFYVGFGGTCIQAAVYMNKPVLFFDVMPHKVDYGRYVEDILKLWKSKLREPGSFRNYPGLTTTCHWNESEKKYINSIGNMKCDENARETYIKTYLGFKDGKSSERILNVLLNHF